jgi:hypothetical protein
LRCGSNAIDIEERRVRKTARKADDAGLAQQFEQFTYGRGFDVVESISKLHRGVPSQKEM